tara:strand:+ start:987 stop:1685 length:699 start_codon:yes stop_codon:yes gene_type:complete
VRYWINRRARELSLRFMYSMDIDDIGTLNNFDNIDSDISNFWDSNPIANYYMLKKMVISDEEMIVIGCSLLRSGKVFLRIINFKKFTEIISSANNIKNFKNFLKIYNSNEKFKGEDSTYYEILKNVFDSSKKIVTKNIIKDKATEIINGCIKNIKPIDDQIDQSTKNWKFSRINSIDLNILRIAVYEILFSKGIPVPVSIKEAIVLALKYSSDESCSFINGILDNISKRALQ